VAHLALYREFRPQRFAEVVGQQHITRTLRNALIHNRINHAYLLSGPRGTGKTTVARLLAKAVNCLHPEAGEPCNACTACRSIIDGETMDVIEIDAASNRGIDEIRDLRDKVKYAPADLKYKVYIIDEVHMLSEPAFNALLKTLEEPPSHVIFVLATTEKHKLPVTIISRCQSFEYHRLASQEIVDRLYEVCIKYDLVASTEALAAMARQADGGMRDALSLLDQVMAFAEGAITLDDTLQVLGSAPLDQFLKLDQHLISGNVGGALLLLDELIRQGKDIRQLVHDFLGHMRDLLLLKVDPKGGALDLPDQSLAAMQAQATGLQQDQVLTGIRLFAQLESDMRLAASPRLLVEVGLIRLAGLFSGQQAIETPMVATATTALPPVARKAAPPAAEEVTVAPSPEPVHHELSAPTGEGIEQVLQVWDQVLDLVKRVRPSASPLLAQARITRLRGKTLILVAPTSTFAGLLNRPADKATIEKALNKVGLSDMEVQAVGPDDPAAKVETLSAPAGAPTPVVERSLVDVAKSIFPKDIVHELKEELK
jgi:DNA polymerase-3 subunit gamma/tau